MVVTLMMVMVMMMVMMMKMRICLALLHFVDHRLKIPSRSMSVTF
jgi:hypothetical protein